MINVINKRLQNNKFSLIAEIGVNYYDIAKKLNLGNLSLVYKEKCDADLSNEKDIIGDQYVYRVDKDELHAMHVQMIQRQEKEIEQLRMSNCTLNGEIEILKQRIERLEEKLC